MTLDSFRPCFFIPTYNHSDRLDAVIKGTLHTQIPYLLIDDGSAPEHRARLLEIQKNYPNVELIHHSENRGKGHALKTGIRHLFEHGYTHGIQVDSDGQHDLQSMSPMIALAKAFPERMISGRPDYGPDVPRVRKWGRYLTHFCVWVETLSFAIEDSMCGFRVYPIEACHTVISKKSLGDRMQFDTEIMVHGFWHGLKFKFMSVPVVYPEGGRSHFRMFRDNVLMTRMHITLLLGLLFRWPRRFFLPKKVRGDHWFTLAETGSVLGLKFLLGLYLLFGRRGMKVLLLPVALYYTYGHRRFRLASKDFLRRVRNRQSSESQQRRVHSSLRHIHNFSSMIVDKVAAWRRDITLQSLYFPPGSEIPNMLAEKQGAILLTSHFGNIEVCRALGYDVQDINITALTYEKNSQKFNQFYHALSDGAPSNLIAVDAIGVDTGISLQQKIQDKHWVCIMADRVSVQDPNRTYTADFLGAPAQFPSGPFVLASKFDVPIYALHCLPDGPRFALIATKLSPGRSQFRSRQERSAYPRQLFDAYIAELEPLVLRHPLQWFNIYDFWKSND